METARLLREHKDIHFIIVGDGSRRAESENFTIAHKLTDTVHFIGRYPSSAMPYFYDNASLLYIGLNDAPVLGLTAPAKLQGYMASGKPILGMLSGEGADLIADADCGWSVPAESPQELADLILKIKGIPQEQLTAKGMNGKMFCQQHFQLDHCIDNLEAIINA